MRLGILGGTFDPVHFGHLLMAETCRTDLQLDQVRFIPARNPPHKPGKTVTDGNARADMLSFAISGYPEFVVDRRELKRAGPSFTVDTLREIRIEQPNAELFFLMGADSLRDLPTWRAPDEISQLATIAVGNRPGLPAPSREQIIGWVGERIAVRVISVAMCGTDLSGTNLRDRVHRGLGLRFMTPRAVEAYIIQNGLYR